MKNFLLIVVLLFAVKANSQSIKKYPIDKTGCAVYMFCEPGKFTISYSEDSSKVYTASCTKEKNEYGVICVQLKDSVASEDAATLLESYLDFLKGQFAIRDAAGYGKGMHLKDREEIIGIIDYWKDDSNKEWAIQGWTDGKIIAVLYTKGEKQADFNLQQVFFKGFRFPGM